MKKHTHEMMWIVIGILAVIAIVSIVRIIQFEETGNGIYSTLGGHWECDSVKYTWLNCIPDGLRIQDKDGREVLSGVPTLCVFGTDNIDERQGLLYVRDVETIHRIINNADILDCSWYVQGALARESVPECQEKCKKWRFVKE